MQRDELTQDDDIVKTKNVEYKNFIKYDNPHEKKRTFNRFEKYCTPAIREALDYMNGAFVKNVDEFAWALVMPDHAYVWWGIHIMRKWGILRHHLDFNILPATLKDSLQRLRVCNLIVYLNPDWVDDRWGKLELEFNDWTTTTVDPKFNSAILFDTWNTYHGMKEPYKWDTPRVSLATYYYIQVPKGIIKPHSTIYKPLENETPEQKLEREQRAKIDRYFWPEYKDEFRRFYRVNWLDW